MVINRTSNYQGTSLLSPTYKLLFSIRLSRLNPYRENIIGYHQRGFWCNLSTTDRSFFIRYIIEKQREYGLAVC